MQVGAVLVLGGCIGNDVSQSSGRKYFPQAMPSFFGSPAAMLDLLGKPILYRIIEHLQKSDVGPIFLVADDVFADNAVVKEISRWRVHVRSAPQEELRTATQAALTTCRESGARAAIVMQASAYVELDVAEMLAFHAASGQPVTSAQDTNGPLGVMMVGNDSTGGIALPGRRTPQSQSTPLEYTHRQYTNRLSTPLDLRRLAQDALLQRCTIRPNGKEVRPGVWVAPSARVHPRARVVNPSYIGAHTRLRSGVVITRGTNIEHHCEVDRGSVIENATILPHTYLGSNLDIAHSIVNRNAMVDVRRAIEVEISDHSLIGSTSPLPKSASKPSAVRTLPVTSHPPRRTLSEACSAFLSKGPFSSPASVRFSYNNSETESEIGELPSTGDSRIA
jgi:NDP-sugar pyrophosphorylase family protein